MKKPQNKSAGNKKQVSRVSKSKTRDTSFIRVKKFKNHTTVSFSFSRHHFGFFDFIYKLFLKNNRIVQNGVGILLISVGLTGILMAVQPFFQQTSVITTREISSQSTNSKEKILIKPVGLTRSTPLHLKVASIGLNTDLITTSKNISGELQVPERFDVAAWYDLSPTPGELGPSVIVGHLTGYWGDAVFGKLQLVNLNDVISVNRADGSTVNFRVNRISQFPQDSFPTEDVYGNTEYSELRLITCGGVYNYLTGRYSVNTVVFATMDI